MIGKLDRIITFIQPVITDGHSNADNISSWEEIDSVPTVRAGKRESKGNTLVENDRVVFSQTVTWLIRYRSDLNVRMRVVCDMQVYQILGISEAFNGRERYMNVVTNILDNEFWS